MHCPWPSQRLTVNIPASVPEVGHSSPGRLGGTHIALQATERPHSMPFGLKVHGLEVVCWLMPTHCPCALQAFCVMVPCSKPAVLQTPIVETCVHMFDHIVAAPHEAPAGFLVHALDVVD
jgi:hypothetical protein